MTTLNFPTNPTDGDEYLAPNGVLYVWEQDVNSWRGSLRPINIPTVVGPVGATGATGPQGITGATGATTGVQGATGATGSVLWQDFEINAVSPTPTSFVDKNITGFNAYSASDFPNNYHIGLTLRSGVIAGQIAMGWDVEETGNAAEDFYFRVNDDTGDVNTWSSWAKLLTENNGVSIPTQPDDIGCYRIVTTSTGDGVNFNRGTILPGSDLRGVGYYTMTSVNGSNWYVVTNQTVQFFNLPASALIPAEGAKVLFTNNIPTGTWLSIGAVGAVTISYDGVSSASYINNRFVFLAVRIA